MMGLILATRRKKSKKLKRKKLKAQKKLKPKTILALWSIAVKIDGGWRCAYCGRMKPAVMLTSHHIFSVRHSATKYDRKDGICLCVGHHKFYPFSAHESPEFVLWIKTYIGEERYEELRVKSNQIKQWTEPEKREIYEELKRFVKENT